MYMVQAHEKTYPQIQKSQEDISKVNLINNAYAHHLRQGWVRSSELSSKVPFVIFHCAEKAHGQTQT